MNPHRNIPTGLALLAIFSLVLASNVRSAEDVADRGLAIGAKAPPFTMEDANGKERSLSEFTTKGKVALVFYRSADW